MALIGVLLAVPNGTIAKYTFSEVSPTVYNAVRFGIIAAVVWPYIVTKWKHLNKKNVAYALKFGFCMTIATLSNLWAIKLSQASYVSVIMMTAPLVFVVYAIKFDNQKVTRKSLLGLLIAAVGGLLVVVLPFVSASGPVAFYPLATVLAFMNVLFFPLAIMYSKKSHDAGAPLFVSFGISATIICVISIIAVLLTTDVSSISIPGLGWAAMLYSGLAVALLSRVLSVFSYEHLGAFTNGLFSYAEGLLMIIVPIIILGEVLTKEIIFGVILLLIGVYVVESHTVSHHKHAQATRLD